MSSRTRSLPPVARWSVALALVGAVALAISVQAGVWWSVGEVTIGPFGSHHCFDNDCRTTGLAWIGGPDLWMRSAIATGVAGAVASLLLIALAGAAAARRQPRLLARMVVSALIASIACGAYFVVKFPGVAGAGADRGLYLFAVGIIVGLAAAISVLRAR